MPFDTIGDRSQKRLRPNFLDEEPERQQEPINQSFHYEYGQSKKDTSGFWDQSSPFLPSISELDIWSKFNLSFTDKGINMEANVANASDLHSLIDAFSKLCTTVSTMDDSSVTSSTSGIMLCRNKFHRSKPVNYFSSVGRLGRLTQLIPKKEISSLNQIVDACIKIYFSCWMRYIPILSKDEFMQWYNYHPNPENTLIVNAICMFVFRHMVSHHPSPIFEHFLKDQNKIQQQEEYFFDQAREHLSQSFDYPDRYTVVSLLFMTMRAEPSRRHHYASMAVRILHELEIYPRTIDEDDDSYEKEMDTRLWWFAWAHDFYQYSTGAQKTTPQPRIPGSHIDYPRIMEQDIDNVEMAIIGYIQCLRLWVIQSNIISTVYNQEKVMTVEQLGEYDERLLNYYSALPNYLQFDSGFEYGHQDLFYACILVNIEYNATRIMLHKLFIPDVNDPRPSQSSLQSLNISLKTALTQLRTLNTGNSVCPSQCLSDRDELWRASEVISLSMDIYRTCASPQDRDIILNNIQLNEFENGLEKALTILKNTLDFKVLSRNWIQVADWLEVEIRRHQLYENPRSQMNHSQILHASANTAKSPDYFLANLKSNAEAKTKANTQKSTSVSTFTTYSSSNINTNSVMSFSTSSVQSHKTKNQPKFRYFSPKKMNKYMFIDDSP
ncbi:hypothetical protein K501DRAFT_222420, partial [Backusella circina FSU 941]